MKLIKIKLVQVKGVMRQLSKTQRRSGGRHWTFSVTSESLLNKHNVLSYSLHYNNSASSGHTTPTPSLYCSSSDANLCSGLYDTGDYLTVTTACTVTSVSTPGNTGTLSQHWHGWET